MQRARLIIQIVRGFIASAVLIYATSAFAEVEEFPSTPALRLCAAWNEYMAVRIGDFTVSGMVPADALEVARNTHQRARDLCVAEHMSEAIALYFGIEFPIDVNIP